MKSISIITSLFFLIFLYPTGENANINAQNANNLKLTQVISDSVTVYTFSYNSLKLLSEEESKHRYIKYNYNEKGKLISADYYDDPALFSSSLGVIEASRKREEWTNPENTEKTYSIFYEYNTSGQLIKSTNHLGVIIYDYDKNDRIGRQTFYHDDIISNYIDFKYDRKGNMIKRNTFQVSETGNTQLSNETYFKFDKKHNPFQALTNLMLPGKYSNPNNIVKTTSSYYYLIEGMEDETNITETSFEYNKIGFPITKDGNFEYIYE